MFPPECGNGSVVERCLAKANVASSNLVSRSINGSLSRKKSPILSDFFCVKYYRRQLKAYTPSNVGGVRNIKRFDVKRRGSAEYKRTPNGNFPFGVLFNKFTFQVYRRNRNTYTPTRCRKAVYEVCRSFVGWLLFLKDLFHNFCKLRRRAVKKNAHTVDFCRQNSDTDGRAD